jgi:putative MFS transporter
MFLIDRIGRKRWFLIGFGMAVLGTAAGGIAFGLLHSTSWEVLLLTGTFLSMGGYICVINNFLSTAELFPTRMRAWALSTSKCIDALASIVAPTVIGALVTTKAGIGGVFLLLFVLACFALVAQTWLDTGREPAQQVLEHIAS